MLNRTPGWRERYDAVMLRNLRTPFEWGFHDCVMFAMSMVDVQCETHFVAHARAIFPYDSAESALVHIDKAGGLEVLVTEALGIAPVQPALCVTGDVMLYASDFPGFPQALAIHDGHALLSAGMRGMEQWRLSSALKGWRIG